MPTTTPSVPDETCNDHDHNAAYCETCMDAYDEACERAHEALWDAYVAFAALTGKKNANFTVEMIIKTHAKVEGDFGLAPAE